MKKLIIALALVSLLGGGLLPNIGRAQKASEALALSKGQWREDLQYLARELPKRHKNLFHTVSREQFERDVAELDTAIPSLEDHQIIVRMLQITAKVGDAHTYVHLPQTFRRYPVGLYWQRVARGSRYKGVQRRSWHTGHKDWRREYHRCAGASSQRPFAS